jgi:hypothetical protein
MLPAEPDVARVSGADVSGAAGAVALRQIRTSATPALIRLARPVTEVFSVSDAAQARRNAPSTRIPSSANNTIPSTISTAVGSHPMSVTVVPAL